MTDQKIYGELIKNGIPRNLALLIVAQSKHETANYTSNVFRSCNNAFGYKYVGQTLSTGPCTGSPEGDRYAKYATVENSAKELALWIKRRQAEGKFPQDLTTITTAAKYALLLKNSGYYGDSVSNYTNGLLAWFKDNITPVAGIGGIILAIGVFF